MIALLIDNESDTEINEQKVFILIFSLSAEFKFNLTS